ncbi:hypothetical protein GBA52_017721 [Prunus armeniaca]|nr:hypothetical protein GBA52_017721 [Prunus armeniaca]
MDCYITEVVIGLTYTHLENFLLTNDASNFNTEVVGEDGSHRTTDAPNFDFEVMKENLSATENTTVSSYRNQAKE